MVYEDTVPMTQQEYNASAEAIRWIQAKFDEKKLKEDNEPKQQLRCSKHKRNVIESDDDLDLEALLEDNETPAKKSKTKDKRMFCLFRMSGWDLEMWT